MNITRYLIVITLICLSYGCAHSPKDKGQHTKDMHEHVIRVNQDGYVISSDTDWLKRNRDSVLAKDKLTEKYQVMFREALSLACDKPRTDNKVPTVSVEQCKEIAAMAGSSKFSPAQLAKALEKKPIKLLIYVHGGLNTYQDTDIRVEDQLCSIEQGYRKGQQCNISKTLSRDWHYPVYISWPSDIFSTLSEHYFSVREGRNAHPLYATASSVVILFDDAISTIAEFPSNVYFQIVNDKDRFASYPRWGNSLLSSIWHEAHFQFSKAAQLDFQTFPANEFKAVQIGDNFFINRSIYRNETTSSFVKGTALATLSPVRYTIGSLWNGAIAANAWDMMKRHANNMFYPSGEFDYDYDKKYLGSSAGTFFENLFELNSLHQDLDIQVTLIGHSMGAIVLNNLLNRYFDQWTSQKLLTNIVYMGAASSINDTLEIIPKILKQSETPPNFYNLMLNRVAEVAEVYGYGLLPSGSLLVSIDKYHDEPEHHLKRTFGSEINVHSSLPTILDAFDGIKSNVIFKSFNNINGESPIMHGEFGDLNFWLSETWQIETPNHQAVDFKKQQPVEYVPSYKPKKNLEIDVFKQTKK